MTNGNGTIHSPWETRCFCMSSARVSRSISPGSACSKARLSSRTARVHRIEASADSPLSPACGVFLFRSWSSQLGVRSAIRHPEPRSRGEAQARDGGRTQGAGRQDREREAGPPAAALGFHSGAVERRTHRNRDSHPSLPGRRNCRRRRDECHHGYVPDPASDRAESGEDGASSRSPRMQGQCSWMGWPSLTSPCSTGR